MCHVGDREDVLVTAADFALPRTDADVPAWLAARGLRGLVDIHVHFMPERVMRKVWDFFDRAAHHYGTAWPVTYRSDEQARLEHLQQLGVRAFAPLVYAHKPGMARWLTEWAMDFGARTAGAVPTLTFYPEPDAESYVADALAAGARCAKVHVQVGNYDPRDPALDRVWGLLSDAGVPAVVHCGDGPIPGPYTGLDRFGEVLARHPRLVAVIAHAGMPDFAGALALADRYDNVHLDTTMVGTAFSQAMAPLPADWTARLADIADRVVLGSDFPNIPYEYAEQLAAIDGWARADDRLGDAFLRAVVHDTGARLLGLS
jgi:hypothetical protein